MTRPTPRRGPCDNAFIGECVVLLIVGLIKRAQPSERLPGSAALVSLTSSPVA